LKAALQVAAFALNVGLYTAFGYLFYYILPLTTPGLGLVRFWPQVIIPAVFAVIFGPWVGGFGAALGIFINDMLIHGNPILSLMAGVTSNFAGFWLLGYIANRNMDWKIPMLGFGIVSALLVGVAYAFVTPFEYMIFASGLVVGSYIALLIVVWLTPKWRSYEVGSMIGLLIGSAIIGIMVPVFSQFFIMPGNTELTPLAVAAGFGYLIWTFTTEIPFLIILGPPILEAVYKAYPSLKPQSKKESK
jgi:hypothetical protein